MGVEATAGAARRIGGFYNQTAEAIGTLGQRAGSAIRDAGDAAVDHIDHEQIAVGGAHGTQLLANLTESKDALIRGIDPNDPAYGSKVEVAMKQFREQQVEPSLDKFRDGFNTEKGSQFAEGVIDRIRTQMFNSSAADISNAAKTGINNVVTTMRNVASNTAMNDPSSVPAQLDLAEHTIGSLVASSALKGTAAGQVQSEVLEKTKEQIVKGGAVGAIKLSNDPEATATEWISKYPQYINGEEARILASSARQQIRARNSDYEMNRRREKEMAADKSTESANQYLIDIRMRDPRIRNDPTAVTILNDNDLTKPDKKNLLELITRQEKPETDARVSKQSFVDLLRQMRDPQADPDKIMQQAWDARLRDPGRPGSLSENDFTKFRQELLDQKTSQGQALAGDRKEFFQKFTQSIDPGRDAANGMGGTALGAQKIYEAEQDARRQEQLLKAKGEDPHQLYDPRSPLYLGKPEAISKYRASLQDQQRFKAQLQNDLDRKGPAAPATPSGPPRITERAERDKLPAGTIYIGPDGKQYRKQ